MSTDSFGNIYTTGTFIGTADFDPGVGSYPLTTFNWDPFYPKTDFFVSKLNSNGLFLWAKAIGGKNDDQGSSIAADEIGNTYITGFYYDKVDFDPNGGIQEHTASIINSLPRKEIFVLKLDPYGSLLWVKSIGNIRTEEGKSVIIGPFGDLLVTGTFSGTVDFDPGQAIVQYTASANYDAFILKMDVLGNLIWAKANIPEETSITLDADANLYLAGTFYGKVDFDPGPDTFFVSSHPGGYPDMYIQKINVQGGLEWVVPFRDKGNAWVSGSSITTDKVGNIFLTGSFLHTVDFDPGADSLFDTAIPPAGYILKLSPNKFVGIETPKQSSAVNIYIQIQQMVS